MDEVLPIQFQIVVFLHVCNGAAIVLNVVWERLGQEEALSSSYMRFNHEIFRSLRAISLTKIPSLISRS